MAASRWRRWDPRPVPEAAVGPGGQEPAVGQADGDVSFGALAGLHHQGQGDDQRGSLIDVGHGPGDGQLVIHCLKRELLAIGAEPGAGRPLSAEGF